MHDGYIFTLGVCGTTTTSSPAPALLNSMLAALPPVKRAALLSTVRIQRDDPPSAVPDDPLLDAVVADMHDAELLLFVTPIIHGSASTALPTCLHMLLERAQPLAAAGVLHGRVAALVGVEAAEQVEQAGALDRIIYKQTIFAPLHRFCVAAGIQVAGTILLAAESDAAVGTPPAQALAQRAYAQVRQRLPHALPDTW